MARPPATSRSRSSKPASRTSASGARKRPQRKKKPNRFVAFVASIPTRIKRLFIKIFLGLSVVSATFPAVTEGLSEWLGSRVDTDQLQSIMAIPILGNILRHTQLPAGIGTASAHAPSAKPTSKKTGSGGKEMVRNPFA